MKLMPGPKTKLPPSWNGFGQLVGLISTGVSDAVLTAMAQAKAKGLPRRTVIFKHALRNALIPIVTLLGLSIPSLIAGAAITETIFSWPGIGSLFIDAVGAKDYPVIMAVAMLSGTAVIVGNLVADVLYGVVDPRIKY